MEEAMVPECCCGLVGGLSRLEGRSLIVIVGGAQCDVNH